MNANRGESSWDQKLMLAAMSGAMAGGMKAQGAVSGSRARGSFSSVAMNNGPPSASDAEGKKSKRRPDRKPFMLDVHGSAFFPSRSMPKACSKYPTVLGETFWRLLAYLDSVPCRVAERIEGKAPHLLVTGVAGSGKSYLMAACAAVLSHESETGRPLVGSGRYYSMNGDAHRTVLLGDCKRWLESEDPLQYFRMELLAAVRWDADLSSHDTPAHPGCLACIEPFTSIEQAQKAVDRICKWLAEYQPSTWLVIFVDQAEELIGRETSIPYRIIEMLHAARLPVLVFSQRTPSPTPWPFAVGATLQVPFRMAQAEFTRLMEQLSPAQDRLWGREMSLWKDVRLWTGGSPGETARLMEESSDGNGKMSLLHRITAHSRRAQERIGELIACRRLEPRQRNILLIAVFAMLLHVPLDWSDKFNVKELRDLDADLSALLQTDCLQSFFHPSDGAIAIRAIPTAVGLASHLALMAPSTLAAIAPKACWQPLFETVVAAMHSSKQLCSEARRRFARFYMSAKLLWRMPPSAADGWCLAGKGHMGEDVVLRFRRPRIILFAGQVPAQYHFYGSKGLVADATASIQTGPSVLLAADPDIDPFHTDEYLGQDPYYDSIVFLPGRTGYHFFDAFVYIPDDRRLYALCTAPVVTTWLKELETRSSPAQLQQHREDGLLTPLILLDNWRETLRKAGFPKISVKCCLMRPAEMLAACGSSVDPNATTSSTVSNPAANEPVDTLASQFVTATNLEPERDEDIDN